MSQELGGWCTYLNLWAFHKWLFASCARAISYWYVGLDVILFIEIEKEEENSAFLLCLLFVLDCVRK